MLVMAPEVGDMEKHVQGPYFQARQVLDDYHCAQHPLRPKLTMADQYRAVEWVADHDSRLYFQAK